MTRRPRRPPNASARARPHSSLNCSELHFRKTCRPATLRSEAQQRQLDAMVARWPVPDELQQTEIDEARVKLAQDIEDEATQARDAYEVDVVEHPTRSNDLARRMPSATVGTWFARQRLAKVEEDLHSLDDMHDRQLYEELEANGWSTPRREPVYKVCPAYDGVVSGDAAIRDKCTVLLQVGTGRRCRRCAGQCWRRCAWCGTRGSERKVSAQWGPMRCSGPLTPGCNGM